MLSHALFWFALLVIVAPSPVSADEAALPSPSELDSHKAFGTFLASQQSEAFGFLLAKYDDALAHERNVVTAMERCSFILAAASDAEDEPIEDRVELGEQCLEELATHYQDDPAAILYRVEQTYGNEREALIRAVLARNLPLGDSDRARLRKLLAEQLATGGDLAGAVREARLARKDNPYVDVSLILARDARARGQKATAVQLASEQLVHTESAFALNTKARFLIELEAYDVARHALDLAALENEAYHDAVLHGRVMEGLGRYDDARREYQQALPNFFNRNELLGRLFALDLAHGSREQAAASYTALRDADYKNDPFLRKRLSLFWAHPSVAFAARDLAGLLALLVMLAVVALAPLCVLVPVHYAGLVRRERGHGAVAGESRWTLPRVALLLGCFFALDTLAVYLCAPAVMLDWLDQLPAGEQPKGDELALAVLVCAVLGLLISGFAVGARELREQLWGVRDAAKGRVFRAFGMVFLVASINRALAAALGLGTGAANVAQPSGLISTQTMLDGLLSCYGFPALAFVTVICAPVVEELVFRYALTDAVEKQLTFRWANPLQALMFALCHDSWTVWPTLFALAIQAGKLGRETGSLRSSIALHASWNVLASLGVLARSLR